MPRVFVLSTKRRIPFGTPKERSKFGASVHIVQAHGVADHVFGHVFIDVEGLADGLGEIGQRLLRLGLGHLHSKCKVCVL